MKLQRDKKKKNKAMKHPSFIRLLSYLFGRIISLRNNFEEQLEIVSIYKCA